MAVFVLHVCIHVRLPRRPPRREEGEGEEVKNDQPRDCKGREIKPGDLLRSPHFRDRRRRLHYLYHVVVQCDGVLEAVPYAEVITGKKDGGRFWLNVDPRLVEDVEIIASVTHDHEDRPASRKKGTR